MLAEAIKEGNEIKIINFPQEKFHGKHWRFNIESIEEIKDQVKDPIYEKFLERRARELPIQYTDSEIAKFQSILGIEKGLELEDLL
ncbi:MAG: hypothetical protein U9Q83_00175 [Bacteroidota bacterium]|nr:hypothetical protein [Bacteroidota bacterium]